MARAISFWPAPSRPVSATTSPRRATKETSRTRVPSRRPVTSSAGAPGARATPDVAFGLAADHRVGEPSLGPAGEAGGDHLPAVPEHGDEVAEREHLGETVRDVEEGDALRLHAGDRREELGGFALAERRSRLVEDEDLGVRRERLGDLDHLPLGEREVADERRRRDVEAEAGERVARGGGGGLAVEEAEADRGSRPSARFCATVRLGRRLSSW